MTDSGTDIDFYALKPVLATAFFLTEPSFSIIIIIGVIDLKLKKMNGFLYLIAAIFVMAWILGVFIFGLTGIIHILLILAIAAMLIRIFRHHPV